MASDGRTDGGNVSVIHANANKVSGSALRAPFEAPGQTEGYIGAWITALQKEHEQNRKRCDMYACIRQREV